MRCPVAYYGQLIRSRNSNSCRTSRSTRASTLRRAKFYIYSSFSAGGCTQAPLPNKFSAQPRRLSTRVNHSAAATYNFQRSYTVYLLRACAHKSRAFCAFRLFCGRAALGARNNITPCDWIIKCSSPLLYVHQQQQQRRLTADGQTKRLLLHLQQSVLQILRGARAFRCAAAAAGKVVSVCMRLFYMRAAAAATFSREKPLLNKRTVSAWCILQPTNDHQLVFKRVQRTKPHSLCERSGKLSNHNSWAALSRCRAPPPRCSHIFLVSAAPSFE